MALLVLLARLSATLLVGTTFTTPDAKEDSQSLLFALLRLNTFGRIEGILGNTGVAVGCSEVNCRGSGEDGAACLGEVVTCLGEAGARLAGEIGGSWGDTGVGSGEAGGVRLSDLPETLEGGTRL